MTERMQREACIPARAGKQLVHGLGSPLGLLNTYSLQLNSLSFTKTCRARELSGALLVSPGLAKAALTVRWLRRRSTLLQVNVNASDAMRIPHLGSNHDRVLAMTRTPASTRRCLCQSGSPAKDSES